MHFEFCHGFIDLCDRKISLIQSLIFEALDNVRSIAHEYLDVAIGVFMALTGIYNGTLSKNSSIIDVRKVP